MSSGSSLRDSSREADNDWGTTCIRATSTGQSPVTPRTTEGTLSLGVEEAALREQGAEGLQTGVKDQTNDKTPFQGQS